MFEGFENLGSLFGCAVCKATYLKLKLDAAGKRMLCGCCRLRDALGLKGT